MKVIDTLLSPVHQWLNTLQSREKHIVISGAIALLVMLFYLIIWEPITANYEQQQLTYDSQRQLHSWMKNTRTEILALKAAGGASAARTKNQSISSLADRSARITGVKSFINKIEQSKTGVKVILKSADFDLIINWLSDMENKYGIVSTHIKIERAKETGAVDANISLERPL